MPGEADLVEARVWDLPTRAFHWLLVASVATGWWLGDNLSFTNIQWHFYLGYMTGGLVVFRLVWGIVGPPPARLRALFPAPGDLRRYAAGLLKREPSGIAGHNPFGALAVLAMLATLSVQIITGLFSASDDLFAAGPLSFLLSDRFVRLCNLVHEVSSNVLLGLVVLHFAALAYYLVWKRENLIRPMITGIKIIRRSVS